MIVSDGDLGKRIWSTEFSGREGSGCETWGGEVKEKCPVLYNCVGCRCLLKMFTSVQGFLYFPADPDRPQ